MKACKIVGCISPRHAKLMCNRHYTMWVRTGNAETPSSRQRWDLDPVRKRLFHGAKKRAKEQGVPFELHSEDIVVPVRCPVLGIELKAGEGKFADSSASLDRVNPSLGYVPGNVCVISWRANRIKNNATVQELKAIVRYAEHG